MTIGSSPHASPMRTEAEFSDCSSASRHRHGLVVDVFVVARRPVGGEAALEHEARVADERRRRDVLIGKARLECGRVDERLDQRSDLPLRS